MCITFIDVLDGHGNTINTMTLDLQSASCNLSALVIYVACQSCIPNLWFYRLLDCFSVGKFTMNANIYSIQYVNEVLEVTKTVFRSLDTRMQLCVLVRIVML